MLLSCLCLGRNVRSAESELRSLENVCACWYLCIYLWRWLGLTPMTGKLLMLYWKLFSVFKLIDKWIKIWNPMRLKVVFYRRTFPVLSFSFGSDYVEHAVLACQVPRWSFSISSLIDSPTDWTFRDLSEPFHFLAVTEFGRDSDLRIHSFHDWVSRGPWSDWQPLISGLKCLSWGNIQTLFQFFI